ncbi:MBL fold metallo-hydrolase [Tropicimonas sp. S265A]|uniref:MBL fold metallo-hydrolase n=1 Tax=Tropicimonas sp. S265A TaxID=3415134 RepID=UPI003C7ACCCF
MSNAIPPRPARITRLAPGVRRVLADNSSPMTFWGTNSYIIGEGDVAVIDPGPADPHHLSQIKAALSPGERISHILVTHAHLDHSPGATMLAQSCDAAIYAFGDARSGRSARMADLAQNGHLAGGEGVDDRFSPDEVLTDGATVAHGDWALRALWTPGHFGNHLCFAWEDAGYLFSGDLVMGWASSLVSPPDGDLGAFMRSLDLLSGRDEDRVYFPGHGDAIESPHTRVTELRTHRQMRDAQILAALQNAQGSARTLAERIYTDTPAALLPAATRNVLAHLVEMEANSLATCEGPISADAVFHIV